MGTGGPVGLLAGEGRFPEVLARAVRARGRPVICAQLAGESAALAELADAYAAISPGELGRLFQFWAAHRVDEVVIAGRFSRAALPARVAAGDQAARDFAAQVQDRRDHQSFRAFAGLLETRGIQVVAQLAYATDLAATPGVLAGDPLSDGERRDVELGMTVARTLAAVDVGQTVVLKEGAILAVEAAEGTDATIRRGGAMAAGAVVVKVSRPHQDPRFDVPAIGPETVAAMAEAQARVLAVEAHRTIVLDRDELAAAARAAGLTVLAVDAPPLERAAPVGAAERTAL